MKYLSLIFIATLALAPTHTRAIDLDQTWKLADCIGCFSLASYLLGRRGLSANSPEALKSAYQPYKNNRLTAVAFLTYLGARSLYEIQTKPEVPVKYQVKEGTLKENNWVPMREFDPINGTKTDAIIPTYYIEEEYDKIFESIKKRELSKSSWNPFN